ncbi:MAG: FkbM family methyltransferase [Flavobacteriales bacterium]|nr:FkbM family methyltransferase [Flavobacteriales bacterium]
MQRIAQFLFKNFFTLYQPLYWIYKNVTDKENILFFKNYIHEGNTVLDIGANIGFTTLIFSKKVGYSGKTISFEPDTTNFKHLKNLVEEKNLKNVSLINKAISNQSGVLTFYTSPHLNVDHRAYKVNEYASVTEIECISIDDYVMQNQLKPNFIKIDIQGYEYQAFVGMENTIKNNPNLIVFTEFWPFALNKAGYSAKELISLWIQSEFLIYTIKHSKLILTTEKEISKYYSWPENKFCNFVLSKNKLN